MDKAIQALQDAKQGYLASIAQMQLDLSDLNTKQLAVQERIDQTYADVTELTDAIDLMAVEKAAREMKAKPVLSEVPASIEIVDPVAPIEVQNDSTKTTK